MACCCCGGCLCLGAGAAEQIGVTTPTVASRVAPQNCGKGGANFFCNVMADTVGVLWRGATGTVDPWSKDVLTANQARDSVVAQGLSPCCAAAMAKATQAANSSVQQVLKQDKACPNCAGTQTMATIKRIAIYSGIALLVFLVVMHFIDEA